MNTLPTNEEADRLPEAIKAAAEAGVDAFIVADLGVLDACKHLCPGHRCPHVHPDGHHQLGCGPRRLQHGRQARGAGPGDDPAGHCVPCATRPRRSWRIEAFVHGAMCMSVSGRCLLSNYMAGRDANRGQCAQPCRWKYYLSEETRPGQLYEIGENENGSYILNANDLCTAPVPGPYLQGRCGQPEDRGPCQDLLLCGQRDRRLPQGAGRSTWPTRSTTTLRCLPEQVLRGADPHQPPPLLARLLLWPRAGPTGHRQRYLHPRVGVCGHGGRLGERRCLLPAARQVEPGRHAGSPLPGWPQHSAEPWSGSKTRPVDGRGDHPARHGKIHHPHPGAAAHEPASPGKSEIIIRIYTKRSSPARRASFLMQSYPKSFVLPG